MLDHIIISVSDLAASKAMVDLGVDAFHGAILRVDVDQNVSTAPYYGIPLDNPFAGNRLLCAVMAPKQLPALLKMGFTRTFCK